VRYVRRSAAALLVIGVALLLGIGWVGSERAIHPKARTYRRQLADFPALHPEPVSFRSRTGATISGELFHGRSTKTIVLSHGYGDNEVQMLPYAAFLNQADFTVLTYDMRGRGKSGGEAVTVGALEPLDLISAVDYLAARPDIDAQNIGALGLSLGGAVTVIAAAQDRRIKAVVDDSGFSDALSEIGVSFEHFIGLPAFPFAQISVAISELRAGVNIKNVRPVAVVSQIAPRPLLIIHCGADTVVPPSHSQQLFAAAAEPKQLWLLPTGGHIAAITLAPEEYAKRIDDFFKSALR